jgi:S1-C subfamily serine protease
MLSKPKPQRLYENILAFRTLNTVIRTWVEREKTGPNDQEDYKEINAYIQEHRQEIDLQAMIDTAEMLTKRFPRICAVEVMNGSPAAKGGLKPCDLIESVGETTVKNPSQVQLAVDQARVGQELVVKVRRGDRRANLSMRPAELPHNS